MNLTIFKNTGWLILLSSMPAGLCLNGACVYTCFSIITMATVSHFFLQRHV